MQKKLFISVLAAAFLVTACGKSENTQSAPEQKSETKPGQNSGPNAKAAEAFKAAQPEGPNLNTPLANYTPLDYKDQSATWLTYLAVAQASTPTSDEELLNLFSGRYFNEQDAFKKRELVPVELPRIKDMLAKYKGQKYYSLPFSVQGQPSPSVSLSAFLQSPYNFDTKGFDVNSQNCFQGTRYSNRQNVTIDINPVSKSLCTIKVENVDTAKMIEELRSKNSAHLSGVVYFYVQQVDGNEVKTVVTHVHYDISDKPHYLNGGKVVASFDI